MCLSCSCCCWRTVNAQQLKNGRKSSPVWFVAGTGTAIPLTASAPAGGCRHLSCCVSARGRHHHCHNCLMHPVSDQQLQQMQRSPPRCPTWQAAAAALHYRSLPMMLKPKAAHAEYICAVPLSLGAWHCPSRLQHSYTGRCYCCISALMG